ncbi:zf-HC2 domain-containing protein [Gordonia shandongensis]|uniref:zf-HC2 domain-containing protein n=1 Tax=Gordonia shandongensis TaxID=376351 RepID=UPI000686BF69|nr:zf-HC2 domain-containing protein [Gordonia shandongensis]
MTSVGLGRPAGFSRGSRWLAPASASITPNPDHQRDGFASTEHLHPEAVVAYVDNELTLQAAARADAHLTLCPECAREVVTQSRARSMLKTCHDEVAMPESLRSQLSAIPTQEFDMRPVVRRPGLRRTNRWGR